MGIRKLALQQNEKFYFTGKPCKREHLAKRWAITGQCVECYAAWVADNGERVKASKTKYLVNNPEKRKQTSAKYTKNNPHLKRAECALRRARLLKATPSWSDTEKIKEIYLNCPVGYEVDHIVPLRGKDVSGLHVENNLQYLTKKENKKKGNKL